MPLPITTIGLCLAAAGLKIFGHENKLVEFASDPLHLVAGHLAAENLEEFAAQLRERFYTYQRVKNEDLDRAVTGSALRANLVCLWDALPQKPAFGPAQQLRERVKTYAPSNYSHGLLSQGKEAAIRPAIEACERRLQELKEGNFAPTYIDPLRLILPERGVDWGATLSDTALAELRQEHVNLPDELATVFRERWFLYVCLAFQEEIKTNERVARIFPSVQMAAGFAEVKDVIHSEHEKTRDLIREIGPRIEHIYQRQLDEALAANRLSMEEVRRAQQDRRGWQEKYVSLVQETQSRPAKGAFASLIVEGNLSAAADLKESEIKRRSREVAELPRDWCELGRVNELRHALPDALKCYQQSVLLYRTMGNENDKLLGLAVALCGSASCLMGLTRVSESLMSLGESMKICPVLFPLSHDPVVVACRKDQVRLLKGLVARLSFVGLLANAFSVVPDHSVKEGIQITGPSYKKGLNALKLQQNPFWPTIAEQLGELAIVCREMTGNALDAEGFSWASAEFYRVLAEAEPGTFGPQFASALNNLADILNKFGFRDPDPVAVAMDSIKAYTHLTQPKPEGVAMALDTLGECLEAKGRDNEAFEAYGKGIDLLLAQFLEHPAIFQELMKDLLARYQRLASTLGHIAVSESVHTAAAVLQAVPPLVDKQPRHTSEG